MNRMIFISPFSLGTRGGGGLACLAYYNALRKVYPGDVELAQPEEACIGDFSNAIPIPARSRSQAILSGCMHRYKSFVKDFLKENGHKYTHAVLNGGFYFGDSISEFNKRGIKVVMIHHNYEKEYSVTNKTIFSLYGFFPYLVSRNEKRAYLKSDINCFLTKNDKDAFIQEYGTTDIPSFLISVFDCEHTAHVPSKESCSDKWVITGTLSDFQTYNSIMLFKEKFYPHLIELLPNHRLTIAGRNPGEQINSFRNQYSSSIVVLPNPENMDEVLDDNAIFLCPTSSGSGQKLRVMDGLRKGMPILVHEVSSRGYDMFFDSPFFKVYNDEDSFKKGVIDIINAMKRNTQYKEDIIALYNRYLSFEAGVDRFKLVIDELLSS